MLEATPGVQSGIGAICGNTKSWFEHIKSLKFA